MKHRKLLIISHTEHYVNANQDIVGWGSTITEINYLADFWDEIVHVGCLFDETPPKNALPYTKNNISFVSIPPFGGKSIFDKIGIFFKISKIISTVVKNQKDVSEIQLRLPTSIGIFLLPLFSFLLPRKYLLWIKYAGNWNPENPPISYKFQRWWLINNFAKCTVTLNGFWPNQPKHCLSFENPCLNLNDISVGKEVQASKNFNQNHTLVFIGRLEDAKGMSLILEAMQKVDLSKVDKFHFIGDSEQRTYFEKKAAFLNDKVIFHGFLSQEKVHAILKESNFIVLPSKSEGFPKVIAEAACYGVIPIVSDVGSISHYINENNGFLWKINGAKSFEQILTEALESNPHQLQEKSKDVLHVAKMFTFENYRAKLEKYVLLKPNA